VVEDMGVDGGFKIIIEFFLRYERQSHPKGIQEKTRLRLVCIYFDVDYHGFIDVGPLISINPIVP